MAHSVENDALATNEMLHLANPIESIAIVIQAFSKKTMLRPKIEVVLQIASSRPSAH